MPYDALSSRLIEACELGDEPAARAALADGADVHSRKRVVLSATGITDERAGESALVLAVAYRRASVVRLLLENGADPNAPSAFALPLFTPSWTPDSFRWNIAPLRPPLHLSLYDGQGFTFNRPGGAAVYIEPSCAEDAGTALDLRADLDVARALLEYGAEVTDDAMSLARWHAEQGDGRYLDLLQNPPARLHPVPLATPVTPVRGRRPHRAHASGASNGGRSATRTPSRSPGSSVSGRTLEHSVSHGSLAALSASVSLEQMALQDQLEREKRAAERSWTLERRRTNDLEVTLAALRAEVGAMREALEGDKAAKGAGGKGLKVNGAGEAGKKVEKEEVVSVELPAWDASWMLSAMCI